MEFQKIWEMVVRRKRIVISVFSVFFIFVIIGTQFVTPVYEAKAKMLIESSDTVSSLISSLGLATPITSRKSTPTQKYTTYDTDIALVEIRPVLEKLISNLNLKDRKGEVLKPDKLVNPSRLKKIFPQPYLKVQQYEESDIVEILSYSTGSAEAAKMSNELANLYIEYQLEQTRSEYKAARVFIENQIRDVKQKYCDSLLEKKDFMVKEKTVDTSTEIKNQLANLSKLKEEYRENEIELARKRVESTEIDPDIIALNRQKDLLEQHIEKAKDDLVEIPFKNMVVTQIDLSLTVYQDMYQELLEYLTQVGIAESMTLSNVRLVEPAIEPEKPHSPKKALNYAFGLFLGLFIALSIAFFVEYLDNTIKGPEDFEECELAFLGSIAQFKEFKGTKLVSNTDPNDPIYETYRKIHSSIHFATIEKPTKKLLVSSIEPKEGSSTTTANLGIIYAGEGKKVLLVDADLRRPGLHRLFNLSNDHGLTDILLEDTKVETVIHASGIEGLSVLSSGQRPSDAALLLRSSRMQGLVATLSKEYDVLICDSAPILIKNDAILLMDCLDDMILVSKCGSTNRGAVVRANTLLKTAKITPIGIVLNCT